jgi:hypothetical protein
VRYLFRHVSNRPPPNVACTLSMHHALQRPASFQRDSGPGPPAHPSQPELLSLVSCDASLVVGSPNLKLLPSLRDLAALAV